jgi:hypothetical protein
MVVSPVISVLPVPKAGADLAIEESCQQAGIMNEIVTARMAKYFKGTLIEYAFPFFLKIVEQLICLDSTHESIIYIINGTPHTRWMFTVTCSPSSRLKLLS